MGIEDATDWITAVKGAPADPPVAGRKRRITRVGAPVPREPSGSTEATGGASTADDGRVTGQKGRLLSTQDDN